MKLDAKHFRYLTHDDWRVLTAFEMGSKNHEIVPTPLATNLASLKTGTSGVNRCISTLAKAGLIAKVKNAKYDGYRLTTGGSDYLALHHLTLSGALASVGSVMAVGKESDILLCLTPGTDGPNLTIQAVLKIHRLGRISFRTVANNRTYLGKRSATSWSYMSRLSAQREFNAMRILHDAGFKVPRPVGQSRHCIVMGLVPGTVLRAVPLSAFGSTRKARESRVGRLYADLIEMVLGLAERGLIHGDMNEFNVVVQGVKMEQVDLEDAEEQGEEVTALEEGLDGAQVDSEEQAEEREDEEETEDAAEDATDDPTIIPHIIDFPQITSMSHPQASEYLQRDLDGLKAFFRKRYHFESDDPGPTFADATTRLDAAVGQGLRRLDPQMQAAGFDKKAAKRLGGCHAGAEIDLNDVEVNLDDGGFGDALGEDDAMSQVTDSLASVRTSTGRQKKAAGWSI